MKSIKKWTSRELAAQCVMPRLSVEQYLNNATYQAAINSLVHSGIGGFCVFEGDIKHTTRILEQLQAMSEVPMIFAADFEWGLPMRFSDGTEFPHHMALAKTNDGLLVYDSAKAIAEEAQSVGLSWNLAPVCDINTNPDNPVINIRAFGEDTETVSKYSGAYIEGTQAGGLLACAKHFPGHGDTRDDSHLMLPVMKQSIETIKSRELEPFRNAIDKKVKSIMAGHLLVEAIDDKYPASISEKVIKGLLREELGYEGLVITDALNMKAVTGRYSDQEAIRLAAKAGNNIMLMPADPAGAINELSAYADENKNIRRHLENSARLLLKEKKEAGLIPQFARKDFEEKLFDRNRKLALKAAFHSIDMGGSMKLIPLPDSKTFAGFAFLQKESDLRQASRFFTMLAQATESDCDFGFIDENITDENIEDLKKNITNADFIIFPVFIKGRAYTEKIDYSEVLNRIIRKLADERDYIVIFFGNPYIAGRVDAPLKIKTYSDSMASLAAAIMKLTDKGLDRLSI
ncbi:MAG: glycoside hydrolase family 3 protein [Bacteroidota bacterium]